jgi:hypothetical protein
MVKSGRWERPLVLCGSSMYGRWSRLSRAMYLRPLYQSLGSGCVRESSLSVLKVSDVALSKALVAGSSVASCKVSKSLVAGSSVAASVGCSSSSELSS